MMLWNRLVNWSKSERGSVLVIVAASLVALLGFTALVVDGGSLYLEKNRLQKAMDAAALAGVQELPSRADLAQEEALRAAQANEVPPSEVKVTINDSNTIIRAETQRTVEMTFAKVLGVDEVPVKAAAAAEVRPLIGGSGVIPLGIEEKSSPSFYGYGKMVTLKVPRHQEGSLGAGNFGALALSGGGAQKFKQDLMYGTEQVIEENQIYETQPGDVVGPAKQALDYRISSATNETYLSYARNSKRVVLVPIYKQIEERGGKKKFQIVGFSSFFLESCARTDEGAEVKGYFIKYAHSGSTSSTQEDQGAYGYRLIE